jgi:hypothetical protein
MQEDVARREDGKKEEAKKLQQGKAQAQTVLTLGLDQITKFIYRLDRPLVEGNV